jgi:hypothetical protein
MHEEIELSTHVAYYEAVRISGLVMNQQLSDLQSKAQLPYSDAGTSNKYTVKGPVKREKLFLSSAGLDDKACNSVT